MEILVIKWSCPTPGEARILERSIEEMWMGRSKAISPSHPGWYVGMATYRTGTTVRAVFHVEPESEVAKP